MHWAYEYIGKDWESGFSGPDAFDCWGLVRYIQKKHFNRVLPEVNADAYSIQDVVKNFNSNPALSMWEEVDEPIEGDCALMSQNKRPSHVGIWIDDGSMGGILHSCRGAGVIFSARNLIAVSGYNLLGYYRCKQA